MVVFWLSAHFSTQVLGFTLTDVSAVLLGHRSMQTGQEAACALWTRLLMFSAVVSLSELLITPSHFPCPFALSLPQLGYATTRCYAVKTAEHATTISGAIVPPASLAFCVRELAARGPGSAMTSCLDRPPSIIHPSAASSLLTLSSFHYWSSPFAERSWMASHPPPKPIRPHLLRLNTQPEVHERQRVSGQCAKSTIQATLLNLQGHGGGWHCNRLCADLS